MKKFKLIIALWILVCNIPLLAQFPLQVIVNVTPPYSALYQNFVSNPTSLSVTILNNSPDTYQVYLAGSLENTSTGARVYNNPANPWSAPALIITPGSSVLTGSDANLFSNTSDLIPVNVDLASFIDGILPEGNYQLCVRAYNYISAAHEALSPEAYMNSGCAEFPIVFPTAPVPDYFGCDRTFPALQPQNMSFSWLPSMSIPFGATVMYRFKLVYYPEGIDIQSALESTSPMDMVYEESNILTQSIYYGADKPPLIEGKRYAWRVEAYDPLNQIAFQNNGVSNPCFFFYNNAAAQDGNFSMDFPLSGDTLPWNYMPLVSRFSPYSEDYNRFLSDVSISGSNGTSINFQRDLSWPHGPVSGQSHATQQEIYANQAVFVGVFKRPDESPTAYKFTHGNLYQWEAGLELRVSGADDPSGNISGSFYSGMGKPQLNFPLNADTLYLSEISSGSIDLSFKTSNPPGKLFTLFDLLQTSENVNDEGIVVDGSVDERYVSEVSRTLDFAEILSAKTERLGEGIRFANSSTNACNQTCVVDELYKTVKHGLALSDTGWYYWRVKWLENPETENGQAYITSSIRKFYVADSLHLPSQVTSQEERATPASCIATSAIDPVPAEQRVAVNQITVNQQVKVGLFSMKVTQINWTGMRASGKGLIDIPFLKAPVRVEFSNIQINDQARMFDGEVLAEYDRQDIIPASWMQGGGMLAGLNSNEVHLLGDVLNSGARLTSQLLSDNPIGLPIGIDQVIEGVPVIVGVVSLKFTPTRASLNAVCNVDFTEHPLNVAAGAMDIEIHPSGIGGPQGKAILYLAKDVKSKPYGLPGDSLIIEATRFESNYQVVADSGTYICFDCLGFKSLSVKGKITFTPDQLVEDKADGSIGTARIESSFKFKYTTSQQVIASLNFNHPFQVTGAEGWGFQVHEAWFDFSQLENPPNTNFPPNFGNVFDPQTNEYSITNAWEGFYLKRVTLGLPKIFKKFTGNDRLVAGVEDLIIDRFRLTGNIRVYDILSIDEGNIGNWGYSLDTLKIDFVDGSFTQGGFSGKLLIPSCDQPVLYSSLLKQTPETNDWNYEFRAHPKDDMNAEFLKANLQLLETSVISISIPEIDSIDIQAHLHGDLSITNDFERIGEVDFKLIEFQDLCFKNSAPYLSCTAFRFNSPQKYIGNPNSDETDLFSTDGIGEGFPINISDIDLIHRSEDGKQLGGIEFNFNINLTGTSNSFSATARMAVLGKIDLDAMRPQRWSYEKLDLDSVGIRGDVGALKVEGYVLFFKDDPIYGNGLKGKLLAEFKPRVQVMATGQFGNKDGLRYWFVDAQSVFNPGIPLFAGINAYGIGGGAWYNMSQTTPPPLAKDLKDTDPDKDKYVPGMSLSGAVYRPTPDVPLGLKATLIFGTMGDEEVFNGDLTLSLQLSGSSISYLKLAGDFYFMSDIFERTDPQVWAKGEIKYDFDIDELSGSMDVFVNAKAGALKGVSGTPQYKAGRLELIINSDDWHVFAGTPDSPIALKFIDLFTADSYLMVGTDLPPFPGPPEYFDLPTINERLDDALGTGSGLAFGSKASIRDTSQFYFLKIKLDAMIGFDLSVMKYSTTCAGFDPGEKIGIGGWYAKGQIYAHAGVAVDIYVDAFGMSGSYEVFSASLSVLFAGGFINPSYAVGYARVTYSCFGGAISGDHSAQINIGKRCQPVEAGFLEGAKVISDMVPQHKEGISPFPPGIKSPGSVAPNYGVDCGISPEVVFNIAVNKVFRVRQTLDDGSVSDRTFRVKLNRFDAAKTNGDVFLNNIIYSTDGFKASLTNSSFLEPLATYKLIAETSVEELNVNTDTWTVARKSNGDEIRESVTHNFKTDKLPENIRPEDVKYTYPYQYQRFLLKSETDRGTITFNRVNSEWFNPQPKPNVISSFFVVFTPVQGGDKFEEKLIFVSAEGRDVGWNRIFFEIPELLNSRAYVADIIRRDSSTIPPQLQMSIETPVYVLSSNTESSGTSNSQISTSAVSSTVMNAEQSDHYGLNVKVRNLQISGRTLKPNEKLLFTFYFATSRFNTVREKTESLTSGSATMGSFLHLTAGFDGPEKFDEFDVNGFRYHVNGNPEYGTIRMKPLVGGSDARIDSWNQTWTKPIIYDYYYQAIKYTSLRFDRFTPDTIGIPPSKTFRFHPYTAKMNKLGPSEIRPNPLSMNLNMGDLMFSDGGGTSTRNASFICSTPIWTLIDYNYLQTITNNVSFFADQGQSLESVIPEPFKTLKKHYLDSDWTNPYHGEYSFRLHFNVPEPALRDNNINGIIPIQKGILVPYQTYTY
jgi:hypothetical protein